MGRYYRDNTGHVHGSAHDRRRAQVADRDARARARGWTPSVGILPSKAALDFGEKWAPRGTHHTDTAIGVSFSSPKKRERKPLTPKAPCVECKARTRRRYVDSDGATVALCAACHPSSFETPSVAEGVSE